MIEDKKVAHDFAIRIEEILNRRLSDDEFHRVRSLLLKVFRLGAELG